MVIDTSAIVAILQDEPERAAFTAAIAEAGEPMMSAASVFEAAIIIDTRYGAEGGRHLDLLLDKSGIEVVAVDADQVRAVREAFRRFGKGRHPAALNFGDCFAYALAHVRGHRLLFKGEDFRATDITPAV